VVSDPAIKFPISPGTGFGIALLYDVKTWIWTRGDNFPLKLLESRIRCPNCGKLGVTVLFAVPSQPKSQAIRPQTDHGP
jgi:hypothetical protein